MRTRTATLATKGESKYLANSTKKKRDEMEDEKRQQEKRRKKTGRKTGLGQCGASAPMAPVHWWGG